jgi:hypothetical protein
MRGMGNTAWRLCVNARAGSHSKISNWLKIVWHRSGYCLNGYPEGMASTYCNMDSRSCGPYTMPPTKDREACQQDDDTKHCECTIQTMTGGWGTT